MADRRALVLVSGGPRELAAADRLLGYRRYYEQEAAPSDARAVGDLWRKTSADGTGGVMYEWYIGSSSSCWVAWENADESAAPYLTSGDVEITDATKGLILRSPNGTRWRVTVNNSGALVVASL